MTAPAAATDTSQKTRLAPPAADRKARTLDDLFSRLKRARSTRDAEVITQDIWSEWLRSDDESINLMMGWAQKAADERNFGVALDFLDQVLLLDPDYSEGWNRRATVHFLMNNHAKSMADIERVLKLEPRHFGALAGLASIMQAAGRDDLALDAYRRALDVYPMMRSAQDAVSELSEKLADDRL